MLSGPIKWWKLPLGPMVFDVQLLIWLPGNCSTNAVNNVLLISHFIKFNLLFFKKRRNCRNRTLLDCLKNQYKNNETFIFQKYQNSLKTKVQMPAKNAPLRTTSNATFGFFSEAWASKIMGKIKSIWQKRECMNLMMLLSFYIALHQDGSLIDFSRSHHNFVQASKLRLSLHLYNFSLK